MGRPEPFPHDWFSTICPERFARSIPDPLASGNGFPNEALNRPTLEVLCEWIREGWQNLQPGDGPPGYSGTSRPWQWVARFPFDGPSRGKWDYHLGWPSAEDSAWRIPGLVDPVPPPTLDDGRDVDALATSRGQRWLSISNAAGQRYVFVLLAPSDKLLPWDVGFRPLAAVQIGLAWEVLRRSIDHLNEWALYAAKRLGTLPSTIERFDVYHDGHSVVDQVARWVKGEETAGSVQPVHIFLDRLDTDETAGADPDSRRISFAPTDVVRDGSLCELRNAAMLEWARFTYGDTSFGRMQSYAVRNAAVQLLWIAGYLAHELMHLAWTHLARALWHDDPDWHATPSEYCLGPVVGPAQIRGFRFGSDYNMFGELSAPSGEVPAVRHYAIYMFQHFVDGLLRHDAAGRMAGLHRTWCASDKCKVYHDVHRLACPK